MNIVAALLRPNRSAKVHPLFPGSIQSRMRKAKRCDANAFLRFFGASHRHHVVAAPLNQSLQMRRLSTWSSTNKIFVCCWETSVARDKAGTLGEQDGCQVPVLRWSCPLLDTAKFCFSCYGLCLSQGYFSSARSAFSTGKARPVRPILNPPSRPPRARKLPLIPSTLTARMSP